MTIFNLLKRLDDRSFLGLRIWEFSFHSLRRRYGLTFVSRIAIRHPLRTIGGILKYQRLFRQGREEQGITFLFEGGEQAFVERVITSEARLLVAVGFCHKPLNPVCPAGRPNHDCLYLDNLDLNRVGESIRPVCAQCEINTIGTQALLAGANMHIMTSALDIAGDVMIPSISHGRFTRIIKCLCPYSAQAIALPLLICGLEGLLISYASGNCIDYPQWLAADRGVKSEMTVLSPAASDRILALLHAAAEKRKQEGIRYHRFLREGNIYLPSH